jgi:hypothetical protein
VGLFAAHSNNPSVSSLAELQQQANLVLERALLSDVEGKVFSDRDLSRTVYDLTESCIARKARLLREAQPKRQRGR